MSTIGLGNLVEAAGLYRQRKRHDDAITTWEKVLEVAPERGDAIYALEELYSEQQRWHDVSRSRRASTVVCTSIDSTAALRVQLGELHEKRLHDLEAAIETTPLRSVAIRNNRPRSRHWNGTLVIPTPARKPQRCSSRSTCRNNAGRT